jgi:hypothetical protein
MILFEKYKRKKKLTWDARLVVVGVTLLGKCSDPGGQELPWVEFLDGK